VSSEKGGVRSEEGRSEGVRREELGVKEGGVRSEGGWS
jgi:hypothetical protein